MHYIKKKDRERGGKLEGSQTKMCIKSSLCLQQKNDNWASNIFSCFGADVAHYIRPKYHHKKVQFQHQFLNYDAKFVSNIMQICPK